jgi:GT2 family glycosyltransferase
MKVAKLILYYNTPGLVDDLCRLMPDAIVADNGSDENKKYTGPNRCIRMDNLGFTKGWNQAVKTVWDEYDAFWLMNSDIELTAASIRRVEEVMADDNVDILTPSYNCWIKTCQNLKSGGLREIKVCEFTAPIIKKRVFEKIGMMDERFVRGYGMEFDFCYQARLSNFRLWVDDASAFYHKGQKTIGKHEGIMEYSKVANFELNKGMLDKYGIGWRDIVFKSCDMTSDFTMNLAVYTTIFGNYNDLKPVPAQTVKADYICITDNPNLKCQGWKTVVVDFPRRDLHPRMRAKFFKLFPFECPELAKKDISIYIDGSIQITANTFIEYMLKNLNSDILLFKHPDRNCIWDELEASRPLVKYKAELPAMISQLASYKNIYPRKGGLYACGVMVRKHTDAVKRLMGSWWWEITKWSWQDQLSFPVVCRLNKITPSVFNENQYRSGYFEVLWHDDGKTEQPAKKQIPAPALAKINITNKISVLMPVRNTPLPFLTEAIRSILNQTHKDFEFVIVDDESDDQQLVDLLNHYAATYPNVKVYRCKHKYLSTALNFGLEKCTGDIIVRMDSDDVAHPQLLKKHIEFFTHFPNAIICGVQINIVQDGKIINKSNHMPRVTKKSASINNAYWFVNHPGVAYKKEAILQLGAYGDIPNSKSEDYTLWCKILNKGFTIFNMADVLINYRVLPGSYSQAEKRSEEWLNYLEEQRLTLTQ